MSRLHYGWVMVMIAVMVVFAYATIVCSFGIFLTPLTTEFGWDRGALSGAYSLSSLLNGSLSIFTGRLTDKYGPRQLVTFGGLMMGLGFWLMSQVSSLWQVYLFWGGIFGLAGACCFIPSTSSIPRWFTGRRGLAMGITISGFGLGGMVAPPLAQYLIDSYGWRQALVVLGLILLVLVVSTAQFMKHSPQRAGLRPYGESAPAEDKKYLASATGGLSLGQAVATRRFWILGVAVFFFMFCVHIILVHLVPYSIDIGIPAMVAAGMMSINGGMSIVGRLSMGFVSDRIGTRLTMTICLVAQAIALLWLLFAREVWAFYVFAVVFGIAYGGVTPQYPLIPAKLFGLRYTGALQAAITFCSTSGAATGPLVAGTIYNLTGNYQLALLISVIVCTLAIILSLVILKAKAWGQDERVGLLEYVKAN